jgi:hypothetical protein
MGRIPFFAIFLKRKYPFLFLLSQPLFQNLLEEVPSQHFSLLIMHPKRHFSRFFSSLRFPTCPLASLHWLWKLALSFKKSPGSCFHAPLLVTEALIASHGRKISHSQLPLQGGQFPSHLQKADRIVLQL